jgi:hypothetical protein
MKIPSLSEIWFKYFEPKSEPLCKETRDILKDCIAKSPCYEKTKNFKKCIQEDIDPECLSYRKQYSRCKRSSIDRTRDFRTEQRYK